MSRHISAEIIIDSPPEVVWEVLSDLGSFEDWNPFILRAGGNLEKGSRLTLMSKPDTKTFTLHPKISECVPPQTLSWVGRFGGIPGLCTGEHHHELQATAEGTRYVQSEDFKGVLVPFVGRAIEETEGAFGRMNAALKARAEHKAQYSLSN
jgi:hypothetical protein